MGYVRYRTPCTWLPPVGHSGGPGDEADVGACMSDLAECFPSIVGKPGVRPWDAARLDDWANDHATTAPELYTARFLLHVWEGKLQWKCGRFDLLDALEFWDEVHRTAFISWVLDPWWPFSSHATHDRLDVRRDSPLPDLERLTPLLPNVGA